MEYHEAFVEYHKALVEYSGAFSSVFQRNAFERILVECFRAYSSGMLSNVFQYCSAILSSVFEWNAFERIRVECFR